VTLSKRLQVASLHVLQGEGGWFALDKAPRNPGTVAEIVSDFTNFRTGKEPFDPATASHCEIFALRNSFDSSEFERQGTTQGETQWHKDDNEVG